MLPYARGSVALHVEEKNLKAVLTNNTHIKPAQSQEEIVRNALDNPIHSLTLETLARGKKNVLLVTSDHTRAVPSKLTLPILLAEIRRGNPDAQITILIATGLHRPTTEEEQRRMFGDDIVDHEHIVVHDAFDDESLAYVSTLPSGSEFFVNNRFMFPNRQNTAT